MPRDFAHLDETHRYIVEDHCTNPRWSERLAEPNAVAELENPFCGDYALVELSIDGEMLREICVIGTGCVICRSSASMMAELAHGASLSDAAERASEFREMMSGRGTGSEVGTGDTEALSGVAKFPVRVKCALLPWATLEDAVARFSASDD